jgi:hypothetical protein
MAAAAQNVLVDTTDDGNCFFSAVYGAAKFHPVAGTLTKLLNCLFKQGSPNGNVQDIGEADFIAAFRAEVARRIRGRVLEEKAAAEGEPTLYAYLHEEAESASAAKVAGLNNENIAEYPFTMIMADASEEISAAFGDPDAFVALSLPDFKKRLASIVATDRVFVSELDFNIIKYIIGRCGLKIEMINLEGAAAPQFKYVQNGQPVLLLHRISEVEGAEHYQYFTTYLQYRTFRDVVMGKKTVKGVAKPVTLEDRVEANKKHKTYVGGPTVVEPVIYKSGVAGAVVDDEVRGNIQEAVDIAKAAKASMVPAKSAAATKKKNAPPTKKKNSPPKTTKKKSPPKATKTKGTSHLMMAMLNSNSSSA